MLRRLSNGEDNLHIGIERGGVLRTKVSSRIEMQLVVGSYKIMPTQQRAAAAIGIGKRGPNAVPGIIAKDRQRDRDIRRRSAEMRVENMR